ncbi:S9 family peptidase, partial [Candidatus Bipolaricaulota bacterium]|nr:S9 family peptidase [Candidatus Bipolaricaulota bacterium]
MKEVRPYGSWESPITAEKVASGTIGLREITEDRGEIYWLESRPSENGRNVVVRMEGEEGRSVDLVPHEYNARSRVHEYGGASYLVHQGALYFTNFADQRIYTKLSGQSPRPLTPESDRRYADFTVDSHRERLISVCEDHQGQGEAENYLIGIDLENDGPGTKLTGGHDFYSSPRLDDSGRYISWLTWDHPNMPWDGTSLHVAKLDQAGHLVDGRVIAGGRSESITQPRWGPNGYLYFISDRTGWWNLYRWKDGTKTQVTNEKAEFGTPDWVFGISTYDFVSEEEIVCTYSTDGTWSLGIINPSSKAIRDIDVPYTSISSLTTSGDDIYFVGGSSRVPEGVIKLDLSDYKPKTIKLSTSLEVEDGYLSEPS